MGFLAPLIVGFIAGTVVMWQWYHRNEHSEEVTRTAEAVEKPPSMAETVDEREEPNLDQTHHDHSSATDNLTLIHGIGPIYAKRLNAAGIQSFAQLAELAPEQITEIVAQSNTDQLIDTHDWIVQAQKLVEIKVL